MFGNLGLSETIVILGIALIVFGPKRLPEIGRMLGKALAQFRKAASDLRETVEREVEVSELKAAAQSLEQARAETRSAMSLALAPPAEPVPPRPSTPPDQTPPDSSGPPVV